MSTIVNDLKSALAFLGALLLLLGQVAVYAPAIPGAEKGLGEVTSLIGAVLALGAAILKLLEAIQMSTAPPSLEEVAKAVQAGVPSAMLAAYGVPLSAAPRAPTPPPAP